MGNGRSVNKFFSQVLTNERLKETYMKVCNLLNAYEVDYTFAFVGAFTMSESKYLNSKDWCNDVEINGFS